MAMHTGENEQGLKKVIDMTRMIAIVVRLIHFYYYCYDAFKHWQLTNKISDELLRHSFLFVSLLGIRGKKSEKLNYQFTFVNLVTGLLIYFISGLILMAGRLDSE